MKPASARLRPAIAAAPVLVAALASGCAFRGLPSASEHDLRRNAAGRTLVMGSVRVDGPSGIGPRLFSTYTLVFGRVPGPRAGDERLFHASHGTFFVLLEPGSYAIRQVHVNVRGLTGTLHGSLETYAPFEVPESGAIYIGSIEMSLKATPHRPEVRFSRPRIDLTDLAVRDRFDEALSDLRRAIPSYRAPVERRLTEASTGDARKEPGDPVAREACALPTPDCARLAPGTSVRVVLEHGDVEGMKRTLEHWLRNGGFHVVEAVDTEEAVLLHVRYFTFAGPLTRPPDRLEMTGFDPSGTRVVAWCRERDRPEDTLIGLEIVARCVRALGGRLPEQTQQGPAY